MVLFLIVNTAKLAEKDPEARTGNLDKLARIQNSLGIETLLDAFCNFQRHFIELQGQERCLRHTDPMFT